MLSSNDRLGGGDGVEYGGFGLDGKFDSVGYHAGAPSKVFSMWRPSAVAVNAVARTAHPGMIYNHHESVMYGRPAHNPPHHSGEGGATPKPRNASPEAHTMAWPIPRVRTANNGRSALGRTCCAMIFPG